MLFRQRNAFPNANYVKIIRSTSHLKRLFLDGGNFKNSDAAQSSRQRANLENDSTEFGGIEFIHVEHSLENTLDTGIH
ncbi:hypothetical protein CIK04_24625 [Vibrio sp. 03_296]|nr:hypothetical protein CIK04_24625 [Vibrio sp. 03_296]